MSSKKPIKSLKQQIRKAKDLGLLNVVDLYPTLPYYVIVFDVISKSGDDMNILKGHGDAMNRLREHIETCYHCVIKVEVINYMSKTRFAVYYDTID